MNCKMNKFVIMRNQGLNLLMFISIVFFMSHFSSGDTPDEYENNNGPIEPNKSGGVKVTQPPITSKSYNISYFMLVYTQIYKCTRQFFFW